MLGLRDQEWFQMLTFNANSSSQIVARRGGKSPGDLSGWSVYADTSDWTMRSRHILSRKMRYFSPAVKWPGSDALQVQCESGLMADGLVRRGAEVWAVETREDMLGFAQARSVANGYRVHYRQAGTVTEMPFLDASFDIVLLDHVFERGGDVSAILTEMFRILRPGGTLLFTTVNRTWRSRICAGLAPRLFLPGLPPSITKFRGVRPRLLRKKLEKAGFELEFSSGISLHPGSIFGRVHYRFTERKSGIYLGAARKCGS